MLFCHLNEDSSLHMQQFLPPKVYQRGENIKKIELVKINMSKAEQTGNQHIKAALKSVFESRQPAAAVQVLNA